MLNLEISVLKKISNPEPGREYVHKHSDVVGYNITSQKKKKNLNAILFGSLT